jgi:hypothetical protein
MVCDPMYPHPPVTRIQGPLDIGDDDSEVIVVDLFVLMVIVSCRYEWLMVVLLVCLFVVRMIESKSILFHNT